MSVKLQHTRSTLAFLFFIAILFLSSCSGSKNVASNSSKGKTPTKAPKHSAEANKVVSTAKSYIGTKYKTGGTTKKGMDCSGLALTAYQSVDIQLPRTSSEQSKFGKRVYIGELQPGDLVFFGANKGSKKVNHVGIITSVSEKSILFVHASTSSGVREDDVLSDYFKPRYINATRPLEK